MSFSEPRAQEKSCDANTQSLDEASHIKSGGRGYGAAIAAQGLALVTVAQLDLRERRWKRHTRVPTEQLRFMESFTSAESPGVSAI